MVIHMYWSIKVTVVGQFVGNQGNVGLAQLVGQFYETGPQ